MKEEEENELIERFAHEPEPRKLLVSQFHLAALCWFFLLALSPQRLGTRVILRMYISSARHPTNY